VEEFWKNLSECSRHVSHEATKLSLSFSKPPLPNADVLEPMCRSTEMSCLALLSTFYKFPSQQGITIRKQLRQDIVAILRSLCCLLTDLRDYKSKGKKQLQVTGNVWENCEKIEHYLKDNKAAVLKLISSHDDLIKDALQELDEAIREQLNESNEDTENKDENSDNEDEEMESKWQKNELDVARAALGLVKTAQTCSKKTHQIILSKGSCVEFQQQLDDIAALVEELSPVVDDFVSSLYPPMRILVVMQNADVVASRLRALLEAIKNSHCYSEDDTSWWDFLVKATEHNLTKVENLTGKSRLG